MRILLCLFLCGALHADVAKLVDPLVASLPGSALDESDETLKKVVDAGGPAFVYLCSKLAEADGSKDGKVRWMMQGVSHQIMGSNNATARKAMEKALLDALASGKHGTEASTFLLRQLRITGTVDAVEPVGKLLKNEALIDPATQALLAMANDVDQDYIAEQLRPALPHLSVLKALGSLRDSASVPAFLEATKSADSATRLVALRALANTGDARGLAVLKAAAESASGYEQNRILSSYLLLGTRLENPDIAREVFASYTGPEHGHVQSKALTDLAKLLGEEAAPDLNAALENQSAYVRDVAGRLLQNLPGESITQAIVDTLKSDDAATRRTAVNSLAKRDDKVARAAIISSLTDADGGVRQAAVEAASALKLDDAVPTLLKLLADGSEAEKSSARGTLGVLPGAAVSAKIGDALSANPNEDLIDILVARAARDQAPALLKAVANDDRKISRAALKGLDGLATPAQIPAMLDGMLGTDSRSTRAAWQNALVSTTLSQVEDPAKRLAPVTARLKGSKGDARVALIQTVGRIGGDGALDILRQELKTPQADEAVRVLSKWADAAPAADLLARAESAKDDRSKVLALRGFLQLTEQALSAGDRSGHKERLERAAKLGKESDKIAALLKQVAAASKELIWSASFTESLGDLKPQKGAKLVPGQGVELTTGSLTADVSKIRDALSKPFTVSAWIKPSGIGGKQRVFSSPARGGWGFGLSGSGIQITTYGVLDYSSPPRLVKAGEWQHISASLDKDNRVRMHLNGALVANVPHNAPPAAWPANTAGIGSFAAAPSENFKGLIRDIQIHNLPLNDARVKALFEQQAKALGAKPGKPQASKPAPKAQPKSAAAAKNPSPRGPSGQKAPASSAHFDYGADPEAGFVTVFNGKDLTGWVGDTNGYTAKDGVMSCSKRGGRVFLKDEYSDFVLRFDFKLTSGANNGLGIRTPQQGDPAYVGMELQILDNSAEKYAKLQPYQYHGSIYGVVAAKRGHQKPVGEWNTQEVICIGEHVKVTLNGVVIVDAYLDLLDASKKHKGLTNKKGFVGFLGHGAEVSFRNIRIRDYSMPAPVAKSAPAGFEKVFNGKDLTNWQGLVANPPKRAAMSADDLAKARVSADDKMRAHWKVEDGVLVFDGKGQSLCTKKLYGDFDMYVDWKIKANGDSGIYLRGSPQLQIWDPGNKGQWKHGCDKGSGGLWNNKHSGRFPLVKADNPIGEWNTFYIRMVNDRVNVYLNGKQVLDNVVLENYWARKEPIYRKEQIELQNHGNTLYFRNIFVRELPY